MHRICNTLKTFYQNHETTFQQAGLILSVALACIALGVIIGSGGGEKYGSQYINDGKPSYYSPIIGAGISLCVVGILLLMISCILVVKCAIRDPTLKERIQLSIKKEKVQSLVKVILGIGAGLLLVGTFTYLISYALQHNRYFSYEKNIPHFPDRATWDNYAATLRNLSTSGMTLVKIGSFLAAGGVTAYLLSKLYQKWQEPKETEMQVQGGSFEGSR